MVQERQGRPKAPCSRRTFLRTTAAAAGLSVASAGAEGLFYEARPAMGSTFELYLYAPGRGQASELFEAAFGEVERIEATFSHYRPRSELARINARAADEAVTTDPEVWNLVARAIDYSRRTGGAFDITVGSLLKAWGFFRGTGRYPTAEELAAVQVGWQQVALDPAWRTIRFKQAGLELDPGGIGKGYALDRVAALLRAHGVERALLSLGTSSLYALGAPPREAGWTVRVPDPLDRTRTLSSVALRDAALSTSGNYEQFFRMGGQTYCHIMDPRTGHPVEGMLQATVVVPRAEDADVLSTAAFVLGKRQGLGLLRAVPGAEALLVMGAPAAGAPASPYARIWNWEAPLAPLSQTPVS